MTNADTSDAHALPVALSKASLASLPGRVGRPTYDRRGLPRSIVHIGVGGFFRAHQALYLDRLLHTGDQREWGYGGVGLLEQDRRSRDALMAQHSLYTLVERGADGDAARVVGSRLGYDLAANDPEAVLERMASPECRIVTLTITEGGYYVNEATGAFNDAHPDFPHDLFRESLRGSTIFVEEVSAALRLLHREGSARALDAYAAAP